MKNLFFALRPTQWVKNLFIFLPLVFGKKLFIWPKNFETLLAFFLFSIAASAVYLINDIIDLPRDKLHPTKRLRPIASGKVKVQVAWIAALVFGALSIILSFLFEIHFGLIIVAYLVFNLLYSKILKDAVILDVFSIGAFFLLRIIAGSIVADARMSHWIIFMSVLLALFLGFNKRRQELLLINEHTINHSRALTQYSTYFIDQMIPIITTSIVVAYMLYTVDAETIRKIGSDRLIYSIPFVYYGIFYYLYLVHKVRKEGDPTRILISDRKMQLNILLWVAVCIGAIYFK
jgi:4-hydroxybenzoate polyprenyltransferase